MERRGQERDIGMQSSMGYNPPQITQDSPVKLPLAPIVSTPTDRRGNATVSTRRGSAIFSPTQVVDQHNHPPPHLRQQLNPPPPPLYQQKEPNPDPDPAPAPTATTATGGASNSKTPPPPSQPQVPPTQSQVLSPAAAAAAAAASESTFNNTSSVRYRECLKNHAAGIGGHIVDGCGEFMSSGEEGTPEALRCAACDCHRNFHRKEVKGEPQQSQYYPYNPNSGNNSNSQRNPLLLHNQTPSSLVPSHHQKHHKHSHSQGGFATRATQPTMVNFGGNGGGGGAAAESSSEDLNMFQSGGGGGHAVIQPSISGSKKRFRTKFSQDQKDRMQEFATKLDWRIQKQDDEEVQQFCSEVGVKRQVFKVWMHNNKQAMKKRQI